MIFENAGQGPRIKCRKGRKPDLGEPRARKEFMLKTDPFAIHDVWLAAVNALPDTRPVAALLRSDTPLPAGARHLLAELFHPGDPPITDYRLHPALNPEFARAIRKFSATVTYRQARANGTTKGQAAEDAAKGAGVDARQVRRWLKEDTPEQLRDRLGAGNVATLDILAPPNVQHSGAPIGHTESDTATHLIIALLSMTG
jgi:hypothetical protein